MTTRENPFSQIRLVFQRSRTLTKVVVLAALVLSMAALLVLGIARMSVQARLDSLKDQAQELEQENARLEQYIDDQGSLQSIERIANDELGLVDPDTVIIQPQQ